MNRRRTDGDVNVNHQPYGHANGGGLRRLRPLDDGSGKQKERPWNKSHLMAAAAALLLVGAVFGLGRRYLGGTAASTNKLSAEKKILTPEEVKRSNQVCNRNIFAPALNVSLASVASQADDWLLLERPNDLERAKDDSYRQHNHDRFFPLHEFAPCRKEELSCVGGSCQEGTGKTMCGLRHLHRPADQDDDDDCIVYSVGYNGHWDFEVDILQRTTCQLHFFDCMGPKERYQPPTHLNEQQRARFHIHHVCLGTKWRQGPAETPPICQGRFASWEKNHAICGDIRTLEGMTKKFNHSRIDLLRLDVDGIEFHLLESWPVLRNLWTSERVLLPMQILLQVHYATYYKPLWSPATAGLPDKDRTEFKFATDMVDLQTRLLQMGYAVVRREPHPQCVYCSDLTLLRFRCPATQAYQKFPVVVPQETVDDEMPGVAM